MATIVGHGTGGVALIMGIEHPDRVARLVLANPTLSEARRKRFTA